MTSSGSGRSGANAGITTSDLAAIRVKDLRRRRGVTAAQFAARCTALGAPAITTNVIANIETRRREITLNELMVFALALDVAPIHLLNPATTGTARNPAGAADQARPLALTSTVQVDDPDLAGRWIHGEQALPVSDERLYYESARQNARTPGTDEASSRFAKAIVMDGAKRLASQYEAQATAFQNGVREQVTHLLTGLEEAVTQAARPSDVAEVLADARARLGAPSSPATAKPARKPRRR
jgi:transcriptional regulator with XRE-family HTH domain